MADCLCGTPIPSDRLSCPNCGRTFKVDPLITVHRSPEPPIEKWAAELEAATKVPSEESMREVLEEARVRTERATKAAQKKRWPWSR